MENDITLDVLDAIADTSDTADNSVTGIKNAAKKYSERLNKDRAKIKEEVEHEYLKKINSLFGSSIDSMNDESLNEALKNKIESSDVVKEASKIIEENNKKIIQDNINENIKKIKGINSDIDSLDKLCEHPQYEAIKAKIDKGYEIYDAYISVVGFGTYDEPKARKSLGTISQPYIQPESMSAKAMEIYKKAFPGKSEEEIIKMYRRDK